MTHFKDLFLHQGQIGMEPCTQHISGFGLFMVLGDNDKKNRMSAAFNHNFIQEHVPCEYNRHLNKVLTLDFVTWTLYQTVQQDYTMQDPVDIVL